MILIPTTVITDIGRFNSDEFGDPKWIILRNNSGLQLQMFWPNKDMKEEATPTHCNNNSLIPDWNLNTNNEIPKKKRSKRKRSPQRFVQSDDELP